MATYSSSHAWKIPGQRSLVGCSPWSHKSQTWLSDWVPSTPPYLSTQEQILRGHFGTLVCCKTLHIYISLIHVPTDMKYERQEDANKESLYTLNDITNNSETFLPFSDSILLNLLKFCTYCLLDLIYTFLSHSSINNILFTFESFWM